MSRCCQSGGCCCSDEGCCSEAKETPKSQQRRCCVCNPHHDGGLMTAQILSIIAYCISWIWWVTWVLATPAMIALQVIWCCRMKRGGIITIGILCFITCLLSLFAGIWILLRWYYSSWCSVLVILDTDDNLYHDDDPFDYNSYYYYGSDHCAEVVWSIVAFVGCALWGGSSYLIWRFVKSGKLDSVASNDEVEEQSAVALELGVVAAIPSAPTESSASMSPTFVEAKLAN